MPRFVDIALPVPLFKTFTYAVPTDTSYAVSIGSRVVVPFGKRTLTGVVVDEKLESDLPRIRPVSDVLDEQPIFTPEMIAFAEWISRYYLCPLGETFKSMLPQGMSPESSHKVRLIKHPDPAELVELRRRAPRQAALLVALSDHKRGVTVSFLQKKVGRESLYAQLLSLEEQGWIEREISATDGAKAKRVKGVAIDSSLLSSPDRVREVLDELDRSAPKQSLLLSLLYARSEGEAERVSKVSELLSEASTSQSVLNGLHAKGLVKFFEIEVSRELMLDDTLLEEPAIHDVDENSIISNHNQSMVIAELAGRLSGEFSSTLLHGVTGSGKTHVYIEVIKRAVELGKQTILLVPEIALTLQLVERFRSVFSDRIVLLHSRMSDGERYDGWKRAAAGECDLVIGPRSALFAPLPQLGMIIVDEEHESSYKQYDAQPRYHARDAAVVRGRIEGALVLLGSATPSIESYYNAQSGKYHLLELPDRVDGAKEPSMSIIDTATARKQNLMRGSLSVQLIAAIKQKVARGEGTILLQNRRGFASRLECTNCAHSPMCPNCAVTLTYHKGVDRLKCHYCGYDRARERSCEVCGVHDLREPGVGTQRVEEDLTEHVAGARVQRMDLDTTRSKGAHRTMFTEFGRGEIDVLLGTQMVAKGLDFPRVSLVGVVSADTQLMLPDFRSGERTFQLITQVAGRAGRRSDLPGEVIVQTSQPEAPSVQAAFRKDYLEMYENELHSRLELRYPPFSRFIVVELKSKDESLAGEHARKFRSYLPSGTEALEILGPTAALFWKLRGWFRFQIYIKNIKAHDPGGRIFFGQFQRAFELYQKNDATRSVEMIVDVDAYSVM